MSDEPNNQSMKDSILKALDSGRVRMKPRWQFITKTAMFIAGIVLIALTALYLGSFIVFMLRRNGVWSTPGFGLQGIGIFLISLPWVLIVVSLIFIFLLEILIKRYSFAYGRPFLYSALGILALIGVGGIALGYTSFHQILFDQARQGRLPVGGALYHQFRSGPENVTVGTITKITDNGYKIEGPGNQIFSVVITPQTQLPSGNALKIGDAIVVLGQRQNNTIQATGIQKSDYLPPRGDYDDHWEGD